MKIDRIQQDKLRLNSILNERAILLRVIQEEIDTLYDILGDPKGNNFNVKDLSFGNAQSQAPIGGVDFVTGEFSLDTDEQRLYRALVHIKEHGEELIEKNQFEQMPALHEDYNRLLKVYEKKFGKFEIKPKPPKNDNNEFL